MTRVAVLGAAGRMGRAVIEEVLALDSMTLVAAVDRAGAASLGTDAGVLVGQAACGVTLRALSGGLDEADVVIDFSSPDALAAVLDFDVALVSGTTGVGRELDARIREKSATNAVLRASNFSAGVALLCELTRLAACAMPLADIEIIEAHHRHKVDAPSGTALALGEAAAAGRRWALDEVAVHGRQGLVGPRPASEIGFHAIRAGDVVGDHTVWLAQPGERVTLGHVATTRRTFALGAVRAASWIATRPAGWYTMRHVLGLPGAGDDQ